MNRQATGGYEAKSLFVCREREGGGYVGCLGNTSVQIIITVTVSAHPTYNRNGS